MAMTLEQILESIEFWESGVDWGNDLVEGLGTMGFSGAPEKGVIIDAIATLYNDQVNARPLLERLANGGILRIAKARPGEPPARAVTGGGESYIVIDVSQINLIKIINLNGEVVFEDHVLAIAHELKHLEGANDPSFPEINDAEFEEFHNSGADLRGESVSFANNVADSLHRSDKKSANYSVRYTSRDFRYGQFEEGENFSGKSEVDNVIVGRTTTFAGDVGNKIETINRGISRDILLGLDGDDSLSSGGGNDHLWGGEGKDIFDAGEGDDRVHGGDGEDTIIGGEGHDQIDGGHSSGFLGLPTDLQQDTLTYDAFGASVIFRLEGANSNSSRVGNVVVQKLGDVTCSPDCYHSEVESFHCLADG
jgi:hypothetical protein